MPIVFSSSGSFKDATAFLQRMSKANIQTVLSKYGQIGTNALRAATPVDTSATASMWNHKVSHGGGKWTVSWHNDNMTSTGEPIAILLQYGHGTGTGGYVAGQDYINPAIKPVFDRILREVRSEVTRR